MKYPLTQEKPIDIDEKSIDGSPVHAKIIDEIRSKLIHNFNLNFIKKKLRIINLYKKFSY